MTRTGARILAVGDSGVGKTALLHKVCRGRADMGSPESTVGAGIEVKLLSVDGGDGQEVFAEFVDVGCHANYRLSRSFYYQGIDAILLVYDMSNWKSFANLKKWIKELSNDIKTAGPASQPVEQSSRRSAQQTYQRASATSSSSSSGPKSNGKRTIKNLPVLVVGNKLDMVRSWTNSKLPNVFATLGFESTNVSSTSDSLADLEQINSFVQSVVDGRGGAVSYAAGVDMATML